MKIWLPFRAMPLSVPWFGYRSESHFFFRLSAWNGLYGSRLCSNCRRRGGLFIRLDFIHDESNPHQSQLDAKPLIITLSVLQSTCVCKFQSSKYKYLRSSQCIFLWIFMECGQLRRLDDLGRGWRSSDRSGIYLPLPQDPSVLCALCYGSCICTGCISDVR